MPSMPVGKTESPTVFSTALGWNVRSGGALPGDRVFAWKVGTESVGDAICPGWCCEESQISIRSKKRGCTYTARHQRMAPRLSSVELSLVANRVDVVGVAVLSGAEWGTM